jgi:hypothetical protein
MWTAHQTEAVTYSITQTSLYKPAIEESTSASSYQIWEKTKPYWDTPGSQPCSQKLTGREDGLTTLNYLLSSEPPTLEKPALR